MAQTRALKRVSEGNAEIPPFVLGALLFRGVVSLDEALDDYDGPCLTVMVTPAGRRVLKEEEERNG